MIKSFISCIALLCFSSLSAQESVSNYFVIVDPYGEFGNPYYNSGSHERLGHIIKLSFPSLNKELKVDSQVWDPENPDKTINVVAAIRNLRWDGGATDSFDFQGRLSPYNKAVLKEALSALPENGAIEVEFVVYEYDLQANRYFKHLHTYKKPIQCTITDRSRATFESEPDDRYIKHPTNFIFEISLTPKNDVKDQNVGFAFRANGTQFSRHIGASDCANS